MVPLAIFGVLAALMSTGVECGYSSASSSSSSNGDGTGHTFTASNNNGQGTYQHTVTKPGGVVQQSTGSAPPQNGFYGPANFGQPGAFNNYGPAFPYAPFGNNVPAYNTFQQPAFGFNGFNAPFQPLPQFQQFPSYAPYSPTPLEFNQYLNNLQNQYAVYYKQQQELFNAWRNAQYQGPYGYGGGVPNYAYATGAFGPNGIQQTAGVYPPNKNKPNLNTRFDAVENAGNGPAGFFGVSTSSFSSSSDVNGIKAHKEGASTTVNDNGKVTTYNVEN